MSVLEKIIDSGRVPEPVLRAGIRAVCALRLRQEKHADRRAFIADLDKAPIAIATDAANAQHYEVPARFFELVLGPHLKYSSAYWPREATTLADAERAMLHLTAQRARLADGQAILDLGCGWGAFSLWAAAHYPNARITAVSSSHGQRAFIERAAAARGLVNLRVITHDVRTLDLREKSFDRVISVEMFEHMRNYRDLLARIAGWLAPGGALFVHVFAHRMHAYPFDDLGASDWMAREFFTGGLMPSVALLRRFQDHLRVVEDWQLGGTHYARTAEAWHDNLLARRDEIVGLLGVRHFHRWRVFFLACAEMFGYRGGREWCVAHYRFAKR